RLTGKVNGWSVGALNMQTKGISSAEIPADNFSVLRIRKDLGKQDSYIGGVFTNKISTSDNSVSNQVFGLDHFHRFNEHWAGFIETAASHDGGQTFSAANLQTDFYIQRGARVGFIPNIYVEIEGWNLDP